MRWFKQSKLTQSNIARIYLFELSRRSSKDALFAGRPRGWEAENLLNILANWHRAQDVKEDEGTFGEVGALQVTMWKSLDPWDGSEWQAGDNFSIKDRVEHGQKRCESETSEEPKIEPNFNWISSTLIRWTKLTSTSFSRATSLDCCSWAFPHRVQSSSSAAYLNPHPAPLSSSPLRLGFINN